MTKKWQICRIWTFLKTVWILGYCVNRLWESSACHVRTELASSQELVCLNSITGLLHLVIPWLKSLGLWFCSHSNLIISSFSPNLQLFPIFYSHSTQTHTPAVPVKDQEVVKPSFFFFSLTSSPSSALTKLPLYCLPFPITATCCPSTISRK